MWQNARIKLKKSFKREDVEDGELPDWSSIEIKYVTVSDLCLTLRKVLENAVVFEYPTLNVEF